MGGQPVNISEEEDYDRIKEGDWVFIRMASGNSKMVLIQKDQLISLGKFGTFQASEIISKPFDLSYEIYGRNKVRQAQTFNYLDHFDVEADETANNRMIIDDPSAQKLSHEEIEELKSQSLNGLVSAENVIKSLVEGSATYEKKTGFAKAKYIKRKEKKFSKIFTAIRPTIRVIAEHYFEKNPFKIRDLRIDSLSQLLNLSNVCAGSKMLLVDDTSGLVASALLNRMNGQGILLHIHDHEVPNIDLMKYFNFSPEILHSYQTLSWSRLEPNLDEVDPVLDGVHEDTIIQRRLKTQERINRIRTNRDILLRGEFDGLVIVSQYDTVSILKTLAGFLMGSRPIVVFSAYKEPLIEAYTYIRSSNEFVNVQLTESWLREYQLPIYASGTHPNMAMSGHGGYLLSALRVVSDVTVLPFTAVKLPKEKEMKTQDSFDNHISSNTAGTETNR